jgi:hypothetical protein
LRFDKTRLHLTRTKNRKKLKKVEKPLLALVVGELSNPVNSMSKPIKEILSASSFKSRVASLIDDDDDDIDDDDSGLVGENDDDGDDELFDRLSMLGFFVSNAAAGRFKPLTGTAGCCR